MRGEAVKNCLLAAVKGGNGVSEASTSLDGIEEHLARKRRERARRRWLQLQCEQQRRLQVRQPERESRHHQASADMGRAGSHFDGIQTPPPVGLARAAASA